MFDSGVVAGDQAVSSILCGDVLTQFPLAFSDIREQHVSDPAIVDLVKKLEPNRDHDRYCISKGNLCLKNHLGLSNRI